MTSVAVDLRQSQRRRFRAQIAAAATLGLALSLFGPLFAHSAAATDDGDDAGAGALRVTGTLPRPSDRFGRPMGVDGTRGLGFATTSGNQSHLFMYDLDRLTELDSERQLSFNGVGDQPNGYTPESTLALDARRERLYALGGYPGKTNQTSDLVCSMDGVNGSTGRPLGTLVFDYSAQADGGRSLTQKRMGPMPCTGRTQFFGLLGSYHEHSDRLYVSGTAGTEGWRDLLSDTTPLPEFLGGTTREDRGQPLLVRQLKMSDGPLLDVVPATRFGSGAAQFELEWEIDLRISGCGRRENLGRGLFEGFVGRLGNELLAYCWDARPYRGLQQGLQGYLVRIPLVAAPGGTMVPQTRGAASIDPVTGQITNYLYRRTPTLPGDVTPILDEASGRVILVTTGPVNGNAVWVFDPAHERFVGVITGGYADEQVGNTAVGFDSVKGRAYVLTQNGMLVAPIRVNPLPAGLVYPVLVNEGRVPNFVRSERIAVLPGRSRLFVAQSVAGRDVYTVLEDHVPDPPTVKPVDPDGLTTQVPEIAGKTAASRSGQAIASGTHVVNTGGMPRTIGQNDPTCRFSPPNRELTDQAKPEQTPISDWEIAPALFGSCLPELALSSGHRDAAAGHSELQAGTGAGATARAAGFTIGSTDTGTDGDIRRFNDCGADTPDRVDRWGRRWPFPDDARISGDSTSSDSHLDRRLLAGENKKTQEEQYNDARNEFWNAWAEDREEGQASYGGGCNQFQDEMAAQGGPDLRSGSKGADGKGFPIPAAVCGDFGGAPARATWPEGADGRPQVAYPSSSASCDAAGPRADARAQAAALTLPSASDPQLSVGRVSSEVTTVATPEGQVTIAFARASSVQIGPLSISEVRSLAITRAHGRTGTTDASLARQLCGLRIAEQFEEGCVDATGDDVRAMLDELNAAVLQKVQLSVPQASETESPGGYQAVVTKHPTQRAGDQTVNDDDSHTVAALQAVVYNDGPKGRSRLVVQLAGVHAESRYGIIQLPPPFDQPDVPPQPEPDPQALPPPAPDPAAPPAADVPPGLSTPESFIDGVGGVEEVVRTNFAAPAPRPLAVPPGQNGVPRILRVPVRAVSDAINLLVQNPREAALLFVLFALLATPLYLGARRRSFARTVALG